MSLAILGIGTAVPAYSISQREAALLAQNRCCKTQEQARILPILYQRTRVRKRGSVLLEKDGAAELTQSFFPSEKESFRGPTTRERMSRYATETAPLAADAARRALRISGLSAKQITHLVTVSCTGFEAPGFDVTLIKSLGLSRTVARTHVGFMGCHGALNGLRTARGFVESDPNTRVLLCAAEICSLHFHYGWDPERIVANALFSDGAAALVAGPVAGAPAGTWELTSSGSCLFPNSEDAITWRIGNHGFEMTLSPRVPELIRHHLKSWLQEWLYGEGLTLESIASWAIHPGGPRVLSSAAVCLGLSPEDTAVSQEVLSECGNMSSPTVLFILERLMRKGALRPCVAVGFGPGLQAEAALLR